MSGKRLACVLLGALALGACASHPYEPAAEQLGASAQTVLVVPLNVSLAMPTQMVEPSERVWQALLRYVQEHDKQVRTVSLVEARRLWLDSVQRARAEAAGDVDFDAAARVFALELGQETPFDAVILPTLFVQRARLSSRRARWDGVLREVEVEHDVHHVGSIWTTTHFSGFTPGASLQVAVLDAAGAKVHEAQAGLALLQRVKVEGKKGATPSEMRIRWVPRPDLFENEADVREGIEKALDPFLAPLPE